MTHLDTPTVGNMPNPKVEKRRQKEWQDFYRHADRLSDFRDRQPPPVIIRHQGVSTEPDICNWD